MDGKGWVKLDAPGCDGLRQTEWLDATDELSQIQTKRWRKKERNTGHTTTQTQNLDMIPRLRPRERQHRRRKEHGLIVRVGNQQADALVAQNGEAGGDDGDGVDVERRNHDGG